MRYILTIISCGAVLQECQHMNVSAAGLRKIRTLNSRGCPVKCDNYKTFGISDIYEIDRYLA